MKRLLNLVIILAILLSAAFIITGCKSDNETDTPAQIVVDFSANVQISGETDAVCKVSSNSQGMFSLTIEKPERIKGYIYKCENGEFSIEYGDIACKANKNYLPDSSFQSRLMNIFVLFKDMNNLQITENADGVSKYKGTATNEDFVVTVDNETGYINNIDIGNGRLTAQFTDLNAFV